MDEIVAAGPENEIWFHGSARLHWPEPTFRNFVAIALILIVASASSHPHHGGDKRRGSSEPAYDG